MPNEPATLFECGNEKCAYAIATDGMNKIKLKALRMWPRTCPHCHQLTKWQEKLPLLDTQTLQTQPYGGATDANTNQVVPKTQSQKRKAARRDGYH